MEVCGGSLQARIANDRREPRERREIWEVNIAEIVRVALVNPVTLGQTADVSK